MRILHLLASPFWSGPAEIVAELAQAQRQLGHDVHIAVDRRRRHAVAEELAVPKLEAAGLLSELDLELSVKSNPLAWWNDLRTLANVDVDVVHSHFSHDHWLVRWANPSAVTVRSLHAPRSIRPSLPRASGYTVPSARFLTTLDREPACVLPPPVSSAFRPASHRDEVRRALGILPGTLAVGMVSTFQPSRRHELGLRAFAQLKAMRPDAHLYLVGDGGLEGALRAQAEQTGIASRVTFAGYQSGDAFVRWLQALDQVWVLGLGNDWSGRAAAQARACGAWVLAVDEGGLPDVADQVVRPEPEATEVTSAALASTPSSAALPDATAIAKRVLQLYEDARLRSRKR